MHAVNAHATQGMSLVECLVALLVLSIGLMGVARLMLEGMRNGQLALFRTQAVNLVSDMAERIRANPGAAGAYDCASYAGGPFEHGCAPADAVPGGACTSAELAEDDLARWQQSARTALPLVADDVCAANVMYTAPDAPDQTGRFRISVSWHEPGEDAPIVHRSDLLLVPSS